MTGGRPRRSLVQLLASEKAAGYLFILPGIMFISVWLILPAINMFYYSTTDARFMSQRWAFVGLENYIRLFEDIVYLRAFANSLYFAVIVVPVQTAFALLMALMVTKIRRGGAFFRTVFFFPVVTSIAIASTIWRLIYQPDVGLANGILKTLGLQPRGFLGDPNEAFYWIMVTCMWKSFGWFMVMFIAGILGIPNELYESGRMDGMGLVNEVRYITLPLLRCMFLFVIVITTMDAIRIFAPVLIMTGGSGGPLNRTNVVMNQVYNSAFKAGELGYASAGAVLLFIVVLLISSQQYRLLNKLD